MAYEVRVKWRKKTNEGRVVYKRPKHQFTAKDVRRIMDKIYIPEEPSAEPSDALDTLRKILESAIDGMISVLAKVFFKPDLFPPDQVRKIGISALDRLLEALGLNPYFIEDALAVEEASKQIEEEKGISDGSSQESDGQLREQDVWDGDGGRSRDP